jgi:hypothetical protein
LSYNYLNILHYLKLKSQFIIIYENIKRKAINKLISKIYSLNELE